MDPAAPNPKQQIVERLKSATNVLVTVSSNPSVDQLAAAIGMTLMLNNMDKHATAVFSGKIPEAMQFLEPDKTLENNLDSLRDFIISLDKEKADKLRYKVEDNVVKIFITPYRTKIDEHDLEFSQGELNVEAVIALGVGQRDDLDAAIAAHGRILHDATVISINVGDAPGNLGSINWNEPMASSLCEMLMSMSEALQAGLVDTQVATALLTGIVAETQRFSNNKTTPKVMTMSAQLMAAGANQQLISNSLNGLKPLDETSADISHASNPPAADSAPEAQAANPNEIQLDHHEPAPVAPAPLPMPEPPAVPMAPTPAANPSLDSWEAEARAEAAEDVTLPAPAQPNFSMPAPMPEPQAPQTPRFQSMPTPVVAPDVTQSFPQPTASSPAIKTKTINPAGLPMQPPIVHGVQSGANRRYISGEDEEPVVDDSDEIAAPAAGPAPDLENTILSHNGHHVESLSSDSTDSSDDPNVAISRAREAVQHAIHEPANQGEEESAPSAPGATPTPLAASPMDVVSEPHIPAEMPSPAPTGPIPTPMTSPVAPPEAKSEVAAPAPTPDATYKIPSPVAPQPSVGSNDVKEPPTTMVPPSSPPPIPL